MFSAQIQNDTIQEAIEESGSRKFHMLMLLTEKAAYPEEVSAVVILWQPLTLLFSQACHTVFAWKVGCLETAILDVQSGGMQQEGKQFYCSSIFHGNLFHLADSTLQTNCVQKTMTKLLSQALQTKTATCLSLSVFVFCMFINKLISFR